MDDSQPQFLEVGAHPYRRRIAYRRRGGEGPALLWLSGFLSDMASTKATAIAEWAAEQGLAMMRFDYSGHGLSGGDLLHASIGDWLEESIALWELMGEGPRIVIGSSMGGWIALLLARHRRGVPRRLQLRHDRVQGGVSGRLVRSAGHALPALRLFGPWRIRRRL
jgi:alpha-beta hydrolase superfamily lysophospholipase